ncbi:hypothetical protein TTRE_0000324701 [Trichuris trichiura]|uniref:Survival motor neuron Tudor domain-containing protein n=1 Tax=Trichuris trichiura TaxID=36087 RepID=A0A077Z382_TRITR|nr:hypothetical protein TTRE_0000324701 [Trichuris trichiura]
MDVYGVEDSVAKINSSAENVNLEEQSENPMEAKFVKPLHPAELNKHDISWDEHALVKAFTESMKLCQAEVTSPYDVGSVSMSAKSKRSNGEKVPMQTTGPSLSGTSDGPFAEVPGGRKSFPLDGSSQMPDAKNEMKNNPSVNHQQPPAWFDEEMSSLLVSWYMAGYYSGQYAAQQEEVSKNGYPNHHE